MVTKRQAKVRYLTYQGFLPSEARELSRISRGGMSAPYIRYMIRSRRRLYDNARRYSWTLDEYREYIKQKYRDIGAIKRDALGRSMIDVWAMVRYYEEKALRRGEEYESPWRKRTRRKVERRQVQKRVTRRDMLKSSIENINRSLARTKNKDKRADLMGRRNYFEEQLKRMD